MSTGSHLSKEIHNLIKQIGETRSKQEEDKIIISQSNILKTKINDKNNDLKKTKENILTAVYIEMLGHDASYAYIHAVNMTQQKNIQLKKMGYLACSLFFDEKSELLILLVANLQKDLTSSNIHDTVIALTALQKLLSSQFVHPFVEPITKLLVHPTDVVRKKSLIILQKIHKIAPHLIVDYEDKIRKGFNDKEPSVMGVSLNLYYEEIIQNGAQKFKSLASNFVHILKQIVDHKLPKDFDYHRFPAPWLQIKLLQILAALGEHDLETSEQIYEVLQLTMRRADDTGINIGYAVTYQCVQTIAQIYPNQKLIEQAVQSIARFLKSDNNNLKYLGINSLTKIVQINPKYVIEHQLTIVDCLQSNDETLKRITLDLLYKMTNENNLEVIADKLVHFLKTTTNKEFKQDLVNKLINLNERLAPTQEWFINMMNTVLEFGSEFVSNSGLTSFIKLILENFQELGEDFGDFIIEIYKDIIKRVDLPDNMMKIVAFVFGEIGNKTYQEQDKKKGLSDLLAPQLNYSFENPLTKGTIISAIYKLNPTHPSLTQFTKSKYIDLQQRALEYVSLQKYSPFLCNQQNVKIDPNLSFLNNYCQQAKQFGAKPYDPKKSLKATGLGGANSDTKQEPELNYQPYKSEIYLQQKQKEDPLSSGIQVSGPKVWTEQGIILPQKSVVEPIKPVQQATVTSMGSSGSTNVTQPTSSSMQGISSSHYQSGNVASIVPTYKPTVQVQPQVIQQNNQKAQLANQLFGGLNVKSQQPSQPVQQKPAISQAKPIGQQQQQVAPQKPQQNLLDIEEPKKQFTPKQITVDQFEQNWNSFAKEKTKDINYHNGKSIKQVQDILDKIGFYIVEVIDEEFICSAVYNQNSQMIIIHLSKESGKLEVTSKSNDLGALEAFNKLI